MIRVAIETTFPTDRMLGEEEGETKNAEADKTASKRKWIIDPIDGTYGMLAEWLSFQHFWRSKKMAK